MKNPCEALIAVTYRCNAKCHMCNIWQYPTKKSEEIQPKDLEKIPSNLKFANITGGEPFLRDDIEDLVSVVLTKTKRLVISSNGYYTERIVNLAKKFPQIGVRVSIEGLPAANDDLRGLKDGFDHGLRTLLRLRAMGLCDIGFGITVSDRNAKDLLELYELSEAMGYEFATAVTHNTYYFHKFDNQFNDQSMIVGQFKELARRLLSARRPKNWFRAYFNCGLANFVEGKERPLACEVATDLFFMDPFGEVQACNGMEASMGNIKNADSFEQIWNSRRAAAVRAMVKNCRKNCWMVGSASPAMKKRVWVPALWVVKNKIRLMKGQDIECRV